MTPEERNILKVILVSQNALLDHIAPMMLMMNAQREQYLGMIKGVGDFMNLMIDVDDPVRRKALFQRLWKEVVDSSVQIQLDKERAKIETLHDTLAAHLQACLKSLEDSDESSFD